MPVTPAPHMPNWTHRIGCRRTWMWRGWQIHYSYAAPADRAAWTRDQQDPRAEPLPMVDVDANIDPTSADRNSAASRCGTEPPPLLMLHGFGASIGHWRKNIPVLSANHPVYALDLLGFGQSQKAAASYNTALWVDQVYEFWQTFIGRPVVLVGHSLGSTVGLAIAAKHPDMLAGLAMFTLPDSSVLPVLRLLRSPYLQPLVKLPLMGLKRLATLPFIFVPAFRLIRRPQTIQKWAKSAYWKADAVDDELVDIFSLPAYDHGATRALVSMVNAKNPDAAKFQAHTVLAELSVPMLLIWGKRDKAVPPLLAPKFLQYNCRIKLVELDDIGHCAHDECADAMNQMLLEWVNQLSQPD